MLDQLPERYRKRIRVDREKGCWIWTGATTSKGRGCIRVCGHTVSTHRYFFEMLVGPVPDGMHLHHKCEVERCCFPEHLSIKTPKAHKAVHVHYQSLRTQCPKGHPYTPENIRKSKHGWKSCRTCFNQAQLKRYHEKKHA